MPPTQPTAAASSTTTGDGTVRAEPAVARDAAGRLSASHTPSGNSTAAITRSHTWGPGSSTAPEIPAGVASSATTNAAASAASSVQPDPDAVPS
jgi:hypothetical protein